MPFFFKCEVLKNGKYGLVLPGVADAIQTLQKRGIKIGTTTGFIQCMVDILLEDAAKQGIVTENAYMQIRLVFFLLPSKLVAAQVTLQL